MADQRRNKQLLGGREIPGDVGMAGAATFPSSRGRASPSVKSVDAILPSEPLVEVHSPGEPLDEVHSPIAPEVARVLLLAPEVVTVSLAEPPRFDHRHRGFNAGGEPGAGV